MDERKTILLTDEVIDRAYEADSELTNLLNPQVAKMFTTYPFRRTESGGWKGEGGFYGETSALGRVLEFAANEPEQTENQV